MVERVAPGFVAQGPLWPVPVTETQFGEPAAEGRLAGGIVDIAAQEQVGRLVHPEPPGDGVVGTSGLHHLGGAPVEFLGLGLHHPVGVLEHAQETLVEGLQRRGGAHHERLLLRAQGGHGQTLARSADHPHGQIPLRAPQPADRRIGHPAVGLGGAAQHRHAVVPAFRGDLGRLGMYRRTAQQDAQHHDEGEDGGAGTPAPHRVVSFGSDGRSEALGTPAGHATTGSVAGSTTGICRLVTACSTA